MATQNFAIHLNGSTQYWTIADSAHHDYATGNAFSIGVRIRPDWDCFSSLYKRYIFSRQNQHELYLDNDELVYYINGASGAMTWWTGVKLVAGGPAFVAITGSESTNTTLNIYLNGELKATTTLTGELPADTNTALYFGVDYSATANQYFKGNMTGFFQSNTNAFTAANMVTMWNSGIYDIDTDEGITGLVDNIGFEEDTGTTYAGGKAGSVSGAGTNTPTWVDCIEPMGRFDYNGAGGFVKNFTGVGQNTRQRVRIQSLEFVDATSADDSFVVTDWNGNLLWEAEADADDDSGEKSFTEPVWANGIKVVTCGGTAKITKLYITIT